MAQAGNLYSIASSSTFDFLGDAAQNAALTWRPALPAALGGRSRFRSLTLQSIQNLDWEVLVFKTSNTFNIPPGGTVDQVHLAGKYRFYAADGVQIAGAGRYYYYIDGLDWAYHDLDSANAQLQPVADGPKVALAPYLNLVVVNRSVTSKIAGALGMLQLRAALEATNA